MITLLTSNWKLAVEILLVVAVLVVLAVWDPFKILGPSEPTLGDTPLSVSSIKEIGELVTAEYYGEVVASLKEAEIEEFEPAELNSEATALTDSLVLFFDRMKDERNLLGGKPNLRTRIYRTRIPQLPFYNPYMRTVAKAWINEMPKLKKQRDKLLEKANGNVEEVDRANNLLDIELSDIEKELLPLMEANQANLGEQLETFEQYFRKWKEAQLNDNRTTRRADVVFIGRGWVKAGFNFEEFNASNFSYDATTNTVFIKNIDPVLLDIDINPWFIPEKQVPGFELVRATGKAKNTRAINRTKAYCKEKLKRQALERDILTIAKNNARESLKKLFSLLLETEVRDVVFTSEYYTHYLAEVLKDSTIDRGEALFLDSVIIQRRRELASLTGADYAERYAALHGFVQKLSGEPVRGQRPFVAGNQPYLYSKYTGAAVRAMENGVVDSTEFARLKALYASDYKSSPAVDTLWFATATAQQGAFVNSMSVLSTHIDSVFEQKTTAMMPLLEVAPN